MPRTAHAPSPVKKTRSAGNGLAIPATIRPMEARLVDALPRDQGWQFEPKWDGFRCLAFRDGPDVDLRAKSGKSLARYFPEVTHALAQSGPRQFVVDGELAVPVDGALSFDALQMRLHPAESRVLRLASETPAILLAFDVLVAGGGQNVIDRPLTERRSHLEELH